MQVFQISLLVIFVIERAAKRACLDDYVAYIPVFFPLLRNINGKIVDNVSIYGIVAPETPYLIRQLRVSIYAPRPAHSCHLV